MKIAVLNGSPKGQTSVTMQYVNFLQLTFQEVEFQCLDVAREIKKLEENEAAFRHVIKEIAESDAVLWSFPLYFFLVPAQYKRFIELIYERDSVFAFLGKYAAVLSTSINFFDHTAHHYMNSVCDDLQMKYVGFYSAEMNDLLKSKERQRLQLFGGLFIRAIKDQSPVIINNRPLTVPSFVYDPLNLTPVETGGKKVLIVADDINKSDNLRKMLENLQKAFSPAAELVQLKDIDIKGGCLGCLHCGMDNVCIYQGKDGFVDFFNRQIKTADVLFFAGKISDRFLSAAWKCFFDRSFYNGHVPVLEGKQIGFIITGPLDRIGNLREILEAYVDMQHSNLIGFVSDDIGSSPEIDACLQSLVNRAAIYSQSGYCQPPTFLRIGGTKLFRDIIWSRLRPVFQADHRYFKIHGYYDFPQKKYKWCLINNVIMLLTRIPFFRREFIKRIKEEMVRPYRKVLDRMKLS